MRSSATHLLKEGESCKERVESPSFSKRDIGRLKKPISKEYCGALSDVSSIRID